MTESVRVHRRLAAILSADVAGYSRMMGDDEVATVRTLSGYRVAIAKIIARHHGRVVDLPGDNLLAEFGSDIDAVEGALAMQRELAARNAQLPEARRMVFRVGVNLGETWCSIVMPMNYGWRRHSWHPCTVHRFAFCAWACGG